MYAWHFLKSDGLTQFEPRQKVEVGQTLRVDGQPIMCRYGLHGSERILDALCYAPGPVVCRVSLGGTIVRGDDKAVATERTCLWMRDISTELHLFACDEAERALEARRAAGHETDPRSWRAIEIKRLWLRGEATDDELVAARAAARDAAWAAALDAARDAALDAARDAALYAALDAARDAAWAAALDAANERLAARIRKLMDDDGYTGD